MNRSRRRRQSDPRNDPPPRNMAEAVALLAKWFGPPQSAGRLPDGSGFMVLDIDTESHDRPVARTRHARRHRRRRARLQRKAR